MQSSAGLEQSFLDKPKLVTSLITCHTSTPLSTFFKKNESGVEALLFRETVGTPACIVEAQMQGDMIKFPQSSVKMASGLNMWMNMIRKM